MSGMEELSPIKSINVNFGTPTVFTPPNTEKLCLRIRDEAVDCEENPYVPYQVDEDVWNESITEEERNRYDELQRVLDEAEDNYNPKIDAPDSPESKAQIAAYDARERFYDNTGKHICFRCSHYYEPDRDARLDKFAKLTMQEFWTMQSACALKRCWVRPLGRACSDFTTDTTSMMKAAEMAFQDVMSRHPSVSHRIDSNLREKNAYRFANMMASPATAFYLYDTNPDYYDKLYEEYANLFQNTKFPTLESLKDGYKRWKQTTTVLRRGNHVTITIRDREFEPEDTERNTVNGAVVMSDKNLPRPNE